MMRIAITGANGYLGRRLTAFLRLRGREVVGIVRTSHAVAMVIESGGLPEIVRDLDPPGLARAFRGCGAIVHLAGISAEREGATYDAVNVGGVCNVIQAARDTGVERIVFLSGLGVAHYGIQRRTTNGYFRAKKDAEEALRRSDRRVVIFRPSYIVGPGDELIPAVLREIELGEVEMVGDGSHRLQPVAVDDAVAAILAAAETPLPSNETFDLIGPEPLPYRQFVERVACAARLLDRPSLYVVRHIAVEEAERQSREGGYRGLLPDELDVLLCDETSDPRPLEEFLGRRTTPLDEALRIAIAGSLTRPSAAFRRHKGGVRRST